MQPLNARTIKISPNPGGPEKKPALTAPRSALGPYPSPEQIREEARTYYFYALREVCPELLYALKQELFPVYMKWAEGSRNSLGVPQPSSFLELKNSVPELARSILQWCSRYYLIGEIEEEPELHGLGWEEAALSDSLWPAKFVCETLWVWSRTDLGTRWLNSDPPQWPQKSYWIGRVGGPLKLTVPIPEPEGFNNEADFLWQATKDFVCHLRKRLMPVVWEPGSRQRQLIKINKKHLTWLALRQTNGWGDKTIAEWQSSKSGEHVEVDAIRMGVRKAAKSVGLRFRSRVRGRPRKIEILPQ